MSRIIYHWEIYCITDSKYEYDWNETEPTTCPTNSAHTISTNPGPHIIDEISQNTVKIKEEDGVTQGLYKCKGFIESVPSGPTGNVTTFTKTWPYPISLLNGWFFSSTDMVTDTLNVTVADGTIIGAIGAPVYAGNTEITVTSTVIDNIYLGYPLEITDGVNLDSLGEITAINTANSIVTVTTPAVNTFSPLSPTYVRLTVPVIEDMYITAGGERYNFAEKKVGGKYLPANTPLYIKYKNNEGNAKTFAYTMEILY